MAVAGTNVREFLDRMDPSYDESMVEREVQRRAMDAYRAGVDEGMKRAAAMGVVRVAVQEPPEFIPEALVSKRPITTTTRKVLLCN